LSEFRTERTTDDVINGHVLCSILGFTSGSHSVRKSPGVGTYCCTNRGQTVTCLCGRKIIVPLHPPLYKFILYRFSGFLLESSSRLFSKV